MKAAGADPIKVKRSKRKSVPTPTFKTFSDQLVTALENSWRNEKHRAQWRSTLSIYCQSLHHKPVNEIDTGDILRVLQPIWRSKPETANRLRGRIEKILDAAKASGHRNGENPARWRGHLDHLLGRRQKLQRGHHPAMPWQDVPEFVARLRNLDTTAARCLEFVILTACRSGEVLRSVRDGRIEGVRWDEIDLDAKIWTVPGLRMKSGRENRKPLCDRAVQIVQEMGKAKRCEFIFPGQRGSTRLSEMSLEALMRRLKAKPWTVHGFRSSFRDWAGESTAFDRELAEAALAHVVGDKVERAYRRGDALERRREVMTAWEAFCSGKQNTVVQLRRTAP